MIDLALLRDNPDLVKASQRVRGEDESVVDQILAADESRRASLTEFEQHRALLAMEREMIDLMELPYRVIDVAAGDLGGPAARKFDCEAWVPTQGKYREVTSTSNCTSFQARRLGVRFKGEGGNEVAATLNGTLATTRWIVALLETHQRADGSVVVPEALRPHLGLDVLEPVA